MHKCTRSVQPISPQVSEHALVQPPMQHSSTTAGRRLFPPWKRGNFNFTDHIKDRGKEWKVKDGLWVSDKNGKENDEEEDKNNPEKKRKRQVIYGT